MSNKTRSVLKVAAIILVVLALLMHMNWVVIPAIVHYKFWMVIVGFGLLLIASK